MFLFMPAYLFAQNQKPNTPEAVVQMIKEQVTCPWSDKTVDTFKAGDPQTPLKGIAVCMFADMNTLREAVKNDCNFIITHEPVFYNHFDETESYRNDPVFQEKMKYINENNLVVFRFHDHIHRTQPDGISKGMIDKLDLGAYAVNHSQTYFRIPETSLKSFASEMKEKLGMESIRIIGNPDMKFSSLAFLAGAPGGQSHIQVLRNPEVEVVLAGEAPEWETYLYANDAVAQGKNKAVVFLGHIKSEEAGMEYCAKWLKGFISNVPVVYIENRPNFMQL